MAREFFPANSWLIPEPVLMIGTYNEKGQADLMPAAWGGIWDDDQIFICLAKDHSTTANIRLHKEFTISFATEKMVNAEDFAGMVSFRKNPAKVSQAGFTPEKAEHIQAPYFKELPMAMECRVNRFIDDEHIVADILGYAVDIAIVNEQNQVSLDALNPIVFDPIHNTYRTVGPEIAQAFSAGNVIKAENE